jgi:hypothetical protein
MRGLFFYNDLSSNPAAHIADSFAMHCPLVEWMDRWKPAQEISLATETPAQTEDAVLELAALLDAEVSVTEIILQALEARIVGLKVDRLRWLLVVAGWVRGCARLMLVHSGFLSLCGPGPGVLLHLRGHFLYIHILPLMLTYVNLCHIIIA